MRANYCGKKAAHPDASRKPPGDHFERRLETALQLLKVSEKVRDRARLNDDGYALVTAGNAAAAVERNALKRGRE